MDHQTIAQLLGSYGEFIGSIAIVVTLAYLAIQNRQSLVASKQQSHADVLARRQHLLTMMAIDRDLIDVLSRGNAQEPLDQIDAQRYSSYYVSLCAHVEDAFLQHRAGLVEDEAWQAEARILAPAFSQPGFREWWNYAQQFMTPEFVAAAAEFPAVNLVLYDQANAQWGTPEGGLFGKDTIPSNE